MSTGALFDDPRKALRFALNHRPQMPRPAMSRAPAGNSPLQRIELADGSMLMVDRGPRGSKAKRNEQLAGMDGVAQAGMVLYHLNRLPAPQQLVLIAQSVPVALPCACRRPCCSGHMPNQPWVHSILVLCDFLQHEAKLSKIKGKKGLSTSPYMRRALVEKFFLPRRLLVLADIAKKADVTEQTVASHNKRIVDYLEDAERKGWRSIDEHLGTAGIVGSLET